MKLSSQALSSFKESYFKRFKVELTDEEANSKGLELLTFMSLIARPIPIVDKELYERMHREYVQDQKTC